MLLFSSCHHNNTIMKNSEKGGVPYKLLLNNNSTQMASRTPEELQILAELLLHNHIFQYLGLAKNALTELCHKLALIWTDHPHILDVNNHQVYLILEGKAFEYMHNKKLEFKSGINKGNDYLMVRKLLPNDFFIVFSPEARYADQGNYKKYQMMVDQGTLIGKIEGEIYKTLLLPLIEERSKRVSAFLREIQMFNYLPHLLMHELSRYMQELSVPNDTEIIKKQDKNPYVYFIQSGEVEFRIYNPDEGRQSPSKNYRTTYNKEYKRVIIKQCNLFGIDSFNAETYEEKQMQYSALSKTNCLLYRMEKRILAIVIASFEESFRRKSKIMNSVNLNDQIQGQGYQTEENAQLTRNASMIKSSEKKIRDIKLRFFETSERKRAVVSTTPFYEGLPNHDDSETLLDYKYQSCQNFAALKINKDKNKKFYQTHNAKFSYISPFQEASPTRVNQILLSAFNQDEIQNKKKPKPMSSSNSTIKPRASFHIRRKSEMMMSGKQERDILRAFLEKKLKNQMIKKAGAITERKTSQLVKKNIQVKRFFSQKALRAKSHQQSRLHKKQIGQELFEKMNKIDQYPLLNRIQGQRKKMQAQAKRILQNKLRMRDRVSQSKKINANPITIDNS